MVLLQKKTEKHRMRFIIEAVSYRIACPVTKVVSFHHGGRYSVCPRCLRSMEREHMAYCNRCGQHLSWNVLVWADVQDQDGGGNK